MYSRRVMDTQHPHWQVGNDGSAQEPVVAAATVATGPPEDGGFPFGWVALAMAATLGMMLPAGIWFKKIRKGM